MSFSVFQDFFKLGGEGLLKQCGSSPYKLLSTVYPDYDWLPWKFDRCVSYYWDDIKNQRKFMDWAGKELGIKEKSDWFKVTYHVNKQNVVSFVCLFL